MRGADTFTATLAGASPDLLAYLTRRVGPDDAPDLLAETMVVAWRRVSDFPTETVPARMWLFGIARGVIFNHARGERRRWALADRLRNAVPTAAPPADEGSDVRDAVARLDPDLAELVRLVHWEQLTLEEASQVLDIPASTARGRYQRAREHLRAALGTDLAMHPHS